MTPIRRILVLVDFSPITDRVVDTAVALAQTMGASLRLTHIVDPTPTFVGYDPGPAMVREDVAHDMREDHRRLQKLADRIADEGVDVTPLMVQGPILDKALEEATQHEAGLIVVGSHGHGALYELVVGSITAGLIREAKVPVLVVPADREG